MKRKRTLKNQPSIKLKRKQTLVYAAAGIAIAAIVGVGIFFYLNLGASTDSKAAAADFTATADGSWIDDNVWISTPAPATSGIRSSVEISEFVVRSGDLSFGNDGVLTVSDSLVIIGSLTMGNEAELVISGDGVLIVTENFNTTGSKITVGNSGVVAVGGDLNFPNGKKDTYNSTGGDLYVMGTTSGNNDADNVDKNETAFQNEHPKAYQIFTDASNGTLPVSLTFFRAKVQGAEVLLEWETAEEINNDFFTIERSGDGRKFEKIATIPGSGNSQRPISYSFTDPFPLPEISYYRLRQTDFDGQFEVFKAVAVSLEASLETSQAPSISKVAPNPFQSSFRVDFTVATSGTALIQLMNTRGRVVASEEVSVYAGRNQHKFYQAEQLQSGIYLLRLVFNGKPSSAARIMKQ